MVPASSGKFIRMVTSTTTSSVLSAIPTVSPDRNDDFIAYFISSFGEVDYYNLFIDDSYGSPCTLILYSDGMSYRLDGYGNIDTVNDGVMQFRNVTDSYGNKNS